MDDRDWLAEQFEHHRTRLRAVAYRMLGSLSEAEDAVQETWLRLSRSDSEEIENLGAWLTSLKARGANRRVHTRADRRQRGRNRPGA
jgi:DNA-directed RNA polymerase specialized sigma24 family protein